MFNAKVSVAKRLMVIGKLLTLLISTSAYAENLANPRFFNYRGGSFANAIEDFSFGWFKKLDDNEVAAYYQSLIHGVMYAENGQTVQWFEGRASGETTPVVTYPTGNGYCRRMYVVAVAYGVEKHMQRTACYTNSNSTWRWIRE
jgi:hypothetical protein